MIRFFAVLIGTFIAISVQAQPDSLWSRTYGGDGSQYCTAMVITQDGGFALGGGLENEDTDFLLIVADEDGQEIWSSSYDLGGYDRCTAIVQTDDGGFVLGGISYSEDESSYGIIRTDPNGEEIWSNTFSSSDINECYALDKTEDGGFIIAGSAISSDHSRVDFYAVKVDSSGEIVWERTHVYNHEQYCMDIARSANGGFVLAGYSINSEDEMHRTNDPFLMKIDREGRALSTHTLESDSWDLCIAVVRANGGGYALAGFSWDNGRYDLFLICIDDEAEVIWREDYRKVGSETCNALVRTPEGGYAIAGSAGASFDSNNFYVLRVDENGQRLWELNYGGRARDDCFEIRVTERGGYALAGYTNSFGEGGSDAWLIVTDEDPVSVPSIRKNLPPVEISLAPAYPNPFNSTTTIRYGLPYPGNVSLQVYNLSGQRMTTLFEGYMQAGVHSTNLIANDLPSGLYFVRLEGSGEVATRKVMLIR